MEQELYDFFNNNPGRNLNELIEEIPCQEIKYSKLLEIYERWRKEFVSRRKETKLPNIDLYSKEIAKNSRNDVDPEKIKQAILLRQKNTAVKKISIITGLTVGKLNYLFTNAKRVGFLKFKEDK